MWSGLVIFLKSLQSTLIMSPTQSCHTRRCRNCRASAYLASRICREMIDKLCLSAFFFFEKRIGIEIVSVIVFPRQLVSTPLYSPQELFHSHSLFNLYFPHHFMYLSRCVWIPLIGGLALFSQWFFFLNFSLREMTGLTRNWFMSWYFWHVLLTFIVRRNVYHKRCWFLVASRNFDTMMFTHLSQNLSGFTKEHWDYSNSDISSSIVFILCLDGLWLIDVVFSFPSSSPSWTNWTNSFLFSIWGHSSSNERSNELWNW